MAVSGPLWITEGLKEAADALFKDNATPEDKEIFLFSDDETITAATVNADLTELTGSGSGKITLTKATWDDADGTDPVVSTYNGATGVSWSITGDLSVYGWAIRGVTSVKIYCARNWGLKTVHNEDTIVITPFDLKWDIV